MVLVSGSALAQLIGVLAAPLLSRLYTPADFGVIGSVMAVVGVLSVISSLKYEMALVLEKDDDKANALQNLCWRLLVGTTCLFGVAILAALWWNLRWTSDDTLVRYLLWALPIIFLTGLFNIYSFRLNRERRYKSLSVATITRSASLLTTQVLLGFCGAKALGLIMGNLVGSLMAVVLLLLTNKDILLIRRQSSSEIQSVTKDHYRFPAYSAPQNFLNSLSQHLPIYLLGYFYGVEVVGAYWFAMRLLQLPAALLGQAIRQVFYKEACDLVDDIPSIYKLFVNMTVALAVIMSLPIIIIFNRGDEIFTFCFGNDWRLAGEFSRWMFLWVGAGFINPPAVVLFSVFSRQKYFACYDCVLFVVRSSVLVIGGLWCSASHTVAMFSFVGAIFNIYLISYWFCCLKIKNR